MAALSDWPNHLARVHVLAHYASSTAYQAYYEPAWGPYPNLGFDLLGVPLAKLLPVELVGQLFLSLVVLSWVAGVYLLGCAIEGKATLRVLIASAFVYGESFLLGYANYAFGMALSMAALGLAFGARPLSRGRRLSVAVIALAASISHAAACVTLVLGAFGFLTGRALSARRRGEPWLARDTIERGLLFVPAGVFFATWLLFVADRTRDRAFSGVRTSARLLFGSLLPTYSENADAVVLLWLLLAVVLAIGTGSGLRRLGRRVRRGPAIAASLCVLAVFAAPADFAGSYEANGRYVLGAWTFALFTFRLKPVARARPLWRLLGMMAVTALVARQVIVGVELSRLSQQLSAQAALLDSLPPEARHLGGATFLESNPPRAQRLRERALLHAVSLAVIRREADVPMLYAIPGVQPLRHRQQRWNGHRISKSHPGALDVARMKADLDAVLLCRAPAAVREAALDGGRSVGVVNDCELFEWTGQPRIERGTPP